MKVLLTTLNAKYIHRNLALRWLYVARDKKHETILKEFTIKDSLDNITNQIKQIHPDVIGLSTYIWNGEYVRKLVPLLKQALPKVRIVLGGPEVSYQYEDYLLEEVDGILLGEGEQTFWQYVNQENDICGLITHSHKNTILPITDISWLEQLESPYLLDFDLADCDRHYLYVEASRGCPYQCGYCLASLDNKVRYFSLDYLFDLFDKLEKRNIKQIKFLDRTFNCDPNRAYQLAKRLVNYKKGTSFQFEIMADTLSDELIDLINNNPDKNKFRFEVGIQSFNREALHEVKRYQNLEKMAQKVTSLLNHHAIVHADLIAGLPKEDLTSFKQTYYQLTKLNVDEMQVGILKLLKGSRLRREMDKYHIVCEKESPYQIISNDWVSKQDIQEVEYCALATERLYNRDLCKETMKYQFSKIDNHFDYMRDLGEKIEQLPRPYQINQIFEIVNNSLSDDKAKRLLLMEYYQNFKQRPQRYQTCDLDKKMKNQIFEVLLAQGKHTQNDIRYCFFDYGYFQNQNVYQILLYNSDQQYPTRYFISEDFKYLGSEDLNERYNDSHL